ncbi:MAG: hypothetical protein ACE37F_20980 [Nannocystaceae bacterium]
MTTGNTPTSGAMMSTTASTSPSSGPDDGTASESGSSGDTEGTTAGAEAPTVVEFTVNGDERPEAVEAAQALQLRVVAEDDGDVVSATFSHGGDVVAVGEPVGDGAFEVEWVVSGAEFNTMDPLQVVVVDDDGLEGTASVQLDVEMPNGGLIEEWTFDSGVIATAYGISPDPEGEEVVWVGQRTLGDQSSNARFARADGGWVDTIADDSEFASDVVRDGQDLVSAISLGFGVNRTTAIRFFDSQGNEGSTVELEGAPGPSTANHPVALERDAVGRLYVLSVYTSGNPPQGSYLMRLSANGAIDWERDLTGWSRADGSAFVHDFDVSPEGRIALAGTSGNQGWIGVLDSDGGLEEQLVVGDFSQSVIYDIAWSGESDVVAVGATNDGDGWTRWARAYSDELLPGWEDTAAPTGAFTQAVGTDHLGRVVTLSAEACELNTDSFAFEECRLVVRKYSPDGILLWQEQPEGGNREFNGPVLLLPGFKPDVEFDRFGYIYFSALHEFQAADGSARSEWWMQKHHP